MINRALVVGMIVSVGMATVPAMASLQSAAATPALQPTQPAAVVLTPTRPDPQRFLDAAGQQLDAVPAPSGNKHNVQEFSQLREDFRNLVTDYHARARTDSSSTGSGATKAPSPGVDWRLKFDDVEHDLALILGSSALLSASPMPAHPDSTPQPIDLRGAVVPEIGAKSLDPGVRTTLELFRRSVELFYDATTGTGPIL